MIYVDLLSSLSKQKWSSTIKVEPLFVSTTQKNYENRFDTWLTCKLLLLLRDCYFCMLIWYLWSYIYLGEVRFHDPSEYKQEPNQPEARYENTGQTEEHNEAAHRDHAHGIGESVDRE